jgi:hypothetical protein
MIWDYVIGESIVGLYGEYSLPALKGHDNLAQGNALCNRIGAYWSPERAK